MSAIDSKTESPSLSPIAASPTLTPGSHYDEESNTVQEKKTWRSWFWKFVTPVQLVNEKSAETSDPLKPITRILDASPEGYSQIAAFQSSDRTFMQYRSFGYLHARVLLALQYDVERLERQLDALDQYDKQFGEPEKLSCKQRDDRQDTPDKIPGDFQEMFKMTRPQVLQELQIKLMEYDEVLLKAKEMSSLQRPSRKDYESVRDWIHDTSQLIPDEQSFIRRKEDIVTLRSGKQGAGFDRFVEARLTSLDKFLIRWFDSKIIQKWFKTPELTIKSSNERLYYYAPAAVDRLVNILLTIIIFILMVLPVVAMYVLSTKSQQASPFEAIAILIIFTLLFGMAMSTFTKATRQELFAASAAYCAVLVVFISNFSTQSVIIV